MERTTATVRETPTTPKLAFHAEPSHRLYRLRLARYKAMAEAIANYVRERQKIEPLNLLDVGCGSGRSLRFLEREDVADQLNFYGLDNSACRIDTIYQPSRWRLTFADVTGEFPYPSEHFDICVCEQVIEHLATPARTVAEMSRVLHPGGLMIVGVPIFPPGIAQARASGVALLNRMLGLQRSHMQTFTCRSFVTLMCADHPLELLACRGFRIISGGPISRLEDYAWWYQMNRWMGRMLPSLCTEVQLVLRKSDTH